MSHGDIKLWRTQQRKDFEAGLPIEPYPIWGTLIEQVIPAEEMGQYRNNIRAIKRHALVANDVDWKLYSAATELVCTGSDFDTLFEQLYDRLRFLPLNTSQR